jgi:regulatory protein
MAFRNRDIRQGNKFSDPELILEKIRYFCSYRERSEMEARQKLRAMQVPKARIGNILKQLKEEGFISDERFAKAYVRGKWKVNHWGRIKITLGLRGMRIPEKFIVAAMEEIDDDAYRNILEELIRKKSAELSPKHGEKNNSGKTLNFRDKLFNFALGKGYESDLIREILDELKI